jgi:hypothetical protein
MTLVQAPPMITSASADGNHLRTSVLHLGERTSQAARPYPEFDYIGLSVFLAPAVTVLTGGLVASIVALGSARIIGASVAWLAIGAIGVIFLDSSPGMVDGISNSGWAAGGAFFIATAFALVSAALLTRQRRLRPLS